MAWGKNDLGIRVGAVTKTTAKILVVATSVEDLTLTIDGGPDTQTPVAVNIDSPVVGYSFAFSVTGLSAGTSYSFSVAQATTLKTGTGTVKTLPNAGTDYSIFFITCNRMRDRLQQHTGMYGYIRDFSEANTVAAVIHLDDTVYADATDIDDTVTTNNPTGTGLAATGEPSSTQNDGDRALVYMADMGMMGRGDVTVAANNLFDYGQSEDRQYVYRNFPSYFQWGDHEFTDNIGWDNNAQANGNWVDGIKAWDSFYGSIMPPLLAATSNHSEGQHWGVEIGDLYITSVDRITEGTGGGTGGTVLYGNTQIDEVLAGINTANVTNSLPFCVLGLTNSIRAFKSDASADIQYMSNEPLADYRATEYARLMTASSTGLQARSNSNGFKFLTIHGDHHNPLVIKQENSGGVTTESFIQVGSGTVNGSQNHAINSSIAIGDVERQATLLYADLERSGSTYETSLTRVDVFGSEADKRMVINIVDKSHKVVFSATYLESASSNIPAIAGTGLLDSRLRLGLGLGIG